MDINCNAISWSSAFATVSSVFCICVAFMFHCWVSLAKFEIRNEEEVARAFNLIEMEE